MRILLFLVLLGCLHKVTGADSSLRATELKKNNNASLASDIIQNIRKSYKNFSIGGTSGTLSLSLATGALMTCALIIVSKARNDTGPFMFGLFSGGLLASLYDFVNHSVGREYAGLACWCAIATNITSVMVIRSLRND
jgi:hypothetical protein